MRFFTDEECVAWCKGYGYPTKKDLPALDREWPFGVRVRYPESASGLFAMAKEVVGVFEDFSTCLVWVTASGIWPSSENLHLYHVWRRSHGDSRFLFEARGHWFLEYERSDLITLLHMALLFAWDVYVLPTPQSSAVFLSHDEMVDYRFSNRESRDYMAEQVQQFTTAPVELLG